MSAAFSHINTFFVLAGCVLLGSSAAVLGCFAFLRKRSLLGDALAHAALPGVCAAFLLTGTKDPVVTLAGAMVSCWLGALTIDLVARHTRVKEDSALGMVLSVYFGLGILMLTHIQRSGSAAQSGLDHYLFGQAAAMIDRDVWVIGIVSIVLVGAIVLLFKEFAVLSFDPGFAAALGMPVKLLETTLATLIVLAVAVGLQAVGVVLMAALLVTPAAAARYWTDRLGRMLVLAGLFGAASGALGALISALSPRMPTGPWIVVAVSTIFGASLLFAPARGILGRAWRRRRFRRQTLEENLLRTLHVLGEKDGDWDRGRSVGELLRYRHMKGAVLSRTLARLRRKGLVREPADGWFALTPDGIARGARLTRLHRLWELYLMRKLELAPDHVHDDAEEIEHIITPELEARLEGALEAELADPQAHALAAGGHRRPDIGPATPQPSS